MISDDPMKFKPEIVAGRGGTVEQVLRQFGVTLFGEFRPALEAAGFVIVRKEPSERELHEACRHIDLQFYTHIAEPRRALYAAMIARTAAP